MYLIWIISLVTLLLYILRIITYFLGWLRVNRPPAGIKGPDRQAGPPPSVSVVIPVRNEEENIPNLLTDLIHQESVPVNFEIIIVDDHSEDDTAGLLEKIIPALQKDSPGSCPNIRILSLDSHLSGKKAALQKGIEAAENPLILNCDGDCRVSGSWVGKMAYQFSEPDLKMLIGPVVFEPDRSFFHAMQSLEFFSLTAVSGGSAGLKKPVLCNAANLAYYKADYISFIRDRVNATESGDDIFLLLWMKKQFPASIRFSLSADTLVRTLPAENPAEFIMQRLRWTSKSRNYRDPQMILTALLTYGINALLMGLLIAGLFTAELFLLFSILFVFKCAVDLLILLPVLRHYGKARLLRYFIPMEIVYFTYVSLVGLLGQFLSFTWKGRRIAVLNKNKSLG